MLMKIGLLLYWHWIKNLSKAAVRLPSFILSWIKAESVPLEKAQDRLFICHNCIDLDHITRQCSHCWCFVTKKVQWAGEECPLGKWNKSV